jgi:DNA-directed RNA polymerase sigma subunit (sigma70/sigma32)
MREEDNQWLQAIAGMEPQLAAVMIRRFGLDGASDQAHAEIGELLDISREAARRAEISAIEQLRSDWGIEIELSEEISAEN